MKQKPVLIPSADHVEEGLTDDERFDLNLMVFRDLVQEIGEEEAKQITPGWQDFVDPETGQWYTPDRDMQTEMVERVSALRRTPIMVVGDPDITEDEVRERLRGIGIDL